MVAIIETIIDYQLTANPIIRVSVIIAQFVIILVMSGITVIIDGSEHADDLNSNIASSSLTSGRVHAITHTSVHVRAIITLVTPYYYVSLDNCLNLTNYVNA